MPIVYANIPQSIYCSRLTYLPSCLGFFYKFIFLKKFFYWCDFAQVEHTPHWECMLLHWGYKTPHLECKLLRTGSADFALGVHDYALGVQDSAQAVQTPLWE
jgi:hypothetical protein